MDPDRLKRLPPDIQERMRKIHEEDAARLARSNDRPKYCEHRMYT